MTGWVRTAIGALKLCAYLCLCLIGIPLQILLLSVHRGRGSMVLPHLFQRISCLIFGLRVRAQGQRYRGSEPVLFVSNHLSYLDIPVLGSLMGCCFVAKKDVAGWPLFGLLAKLQRTVFISRVATDAQEGQRALEDRLKEGLPLVLFPEGTSSNGHDVLPFKSSLFASFLNQNIKIQPITISLDLVDRHDIQTPADRDLYAWYGDMKLEPHLWAFAKSRGAALTVRFHEPLAPALFEERKSLALACHQSVASGLDSYSKAA